MHGCQTILTQKLRFWQNTKKERASIEINANIKFQLQIVHQNSHESHKMSNNKLVYLDLKFTEVK